MTKPRSGDPRGSLPEIIINFEELYEGKLIEYFQGLFYLGKNLNTPYHNFRHCMHVLYLAHEAARYYLERGLLTKRQVRNMLVAALFHDFDHTGVGGDDAKNIMFAIRGLHELAVREDEEHLANIELLIRGTQYPYVVPHEDLPLEGLILRDADLMQAFSPAWIQQVVFGLSAEWGKAPKEVLAMQKSFLGNGFYTDWARLMVPEAAVALKINEAEALLDILNMPASSKRIIEAQQAA